MTEVRGVLESRLHALASGVRPERVAEMQSAVDERVGAGASAKEALRAEGRALIEEMRSACCGCAYAEMLEEWAWVAQEGCRLARQSPPPLLRRLVRSAMALWMVPFLALVRLAVKQCRARCVGVEHEEAA